MSDKELLELAALAAGYKKFRMLTAMAEVSHNSNWNEHLAEWIGWNPLVVDGDALRLAVKLRMDLMLYSDTKGAFIGSRGQSEKQFAEVGADDPYAATRRAIVRAAAEIGRSMKDD